jgi:hypothetical protein
MTRTNKRIKQGNTRKITNNNNTTMWKYLACSDRITSLRGEA